MGYKEKLGVLIAAQAVLLLAVTFLVYVPAVGTLREKDGELAELSKKQADLCKLVEESPNPEDEISRVKAEIQQLDNRMPPESRISWLSARIADAVAAHGVDLRSATHWKEGAGKPSMPELKRMEKTIAVRCPARSLQEFLEEINRLPFVVIVEDLNVLRDQEWGTVSADIRLATFVLRARRPRARSTGETGSGRP